MLLDLGRSESLHNNMKGILGYLPYHVSALECTLKSCSKHEGQGKEEREGRYHGMPMEIPSCLCPEAVMDESKPTEIS